MSSPGVVVALEGRREGGHPCWEHFARQMAEVGGGEGEASFAEGSARAEAEGCGEESVQYLGESQRLRREAWPGLRLTTEALSRPRGDIWVIQGQESTGPGSPL